MKYAMFADRFTLHGIKCMKMTLIHDTKSSLRK